MNFNPEAVRAFEHAGWQRVANAYDGTFARATTPFVEILLDAGGVRSGMPVLDLCCGTGVIAAAAVKRGAAVTGLDFSAAMLAEARRANPQAAFDQGDTEALSYPDQSFDTVVDNFGVHHAPYPARAAAEAQAEPVRREWLVAEPRDLAAALARGTVRTAALILAQPPEAMPRIEAAIVEATARYRCAGGFAVPIVALRGQGTTPE